MNGIESGTPIDQTNFEHYVIALQSRLYTTALHRTHNQQDAEDLVQDTILRAYRALATFREGSDFAAWMYRIMQNTWINNWRKQQRRCTEVAVGSLGEDQMSAFTYCTQDFCSAEVAALAGVPDTEIQAALMALRGPFRLTVYYADVEGFSNSEIAEMMGTPVGTVVSRLHRGRQRLRASLHTVASQRGYGKTCDGVTA